MSIAVRVLKEEWHLVSTYSCVFQVEGYGVECYFTESIEAPTEAPSGNRAGTTAVKTMLGGKVYHFSNVDGTKLYAYPKGNGAVVVVDSRSGATIADEMRFSQITAFGELKVAELVPKAAWAFPYNISTLNYIPVEENGGTVTHSGAFAVLSTGTAVDGAASLATRLTMRYFPGIGGIIRFTAIFTEGVAESEQFIGYGDDTDGLFFGYSGATFGVLRRSGGTDYFTALSDWTDLGGLATGFDPTKLNVYEIQYQWLGGGEIRFFIEDRDYGNLVVVHRVKYANTYTDVSMRNASLPLHAYVMNSGNDTNIVLQSPSASAGLEGTDSSRALRALGEADNLKSIEATTLTPILSVRNPLTYESLANRLSIYFDIATVSMTSTNLAVVQFRILLNATLTGAAFAPFYAGGSPAEIDVAATAVSGGLPVRGITLAGQGNQVLPRIEDARIVPGDILTIVAYASKICDVAASITFDAEI